MINGQTGEVDGESPVSILKVLLLIFVIAVVIGIGFYIYQVNR